MFHNFTTNRLLRIFTLKIVFVESCHKKLFFNPKLIFAFFLVGLEASELEQNVTTVAKLGAAKKSEKDSTLPNVMMKKERNYQGMFEYRIEDEQLIIKHLIYGKNLIYFPQWDSRTQN